MSRHAEKAGTKRSAKINPARPAGHNGKRELFGSWKGRPYGKALKKSA